MATSDVLGSLAKFISDFNNQLSSCRTGSLAQIWMPEPGEDGSVVLNTQGLPYSINGVGDLLALFRCISCKYKFSTDVSKPHQMGAVGRVFTSGEPEMSHNVQRYDQHVYLRAAEAQRCRVHSTLFMPIYGSAAREASLGVFEVVLTDPDVNFAGMVGWIISCLQSENLYTAEIDTASLQNGRVGLRAFGPSDYDGVSALESGIAVNKAAGPGCTAGVRAAPNNGEIEQGVPPAVAAAVAAAVAGSSAAAAASMPPPQQRPPPGTVASCAPEGQARSGGGAPGGGAADAVKSEPAASGGAAAAMAGGKPPLLRMPSGPAPEGMPSPPPVQHQQAANGGGSGDGSGSGQLLPPPPSLVGRTAQSAPDQHRGGSGGSHRLSASLEGRPARMASGSLPGSLPGMHSSLPGSLPNSGSGELPTGSTAQMGVTEAANFPPAVASAVQQLLQQHGGPGSAPMTPQHIAALLSAHGVQPAVVQLVASAAAAAAAPLPLPPLATLANGAPHLHLPPHLQQQQHAQQAQQDLDDMDEDTDDERAFLRPAPGAALKYGQGNRVLTYDDLAAQFGYGLKEAAARLNICPTTLKRACRRLGIPRWPRRELAKHKKQRNAGRAGAGSDQQPDEGGQPTGTGTLGRSSGSGPSSGGSGQLMLTGHQLAAGGGQARPQMARPSSSSLLSGLQGLQGMEHLLQPLAVGGGLAANSGGALPPEIAAALATLQQHQGGPGGMAGGGLQPSPVPNPLVGQVMQLLQQHQQQQQQGGWAVHPQQQQQQQAQQQAAAAQPGGVSRAPSLPQPPQSSALGGGGGGLPPLLPLQTNGAGAGGGPAGGADGPGAARAGAGGGAGSKSPLPPAPLLSNLGLPRRADSKLQSVGAGMGSLDILAAADFEMSVGNMSVGNSPRIALSNLGGLSNLGLSGFDFTGAVAGNGGPAATATGGAGGATGPQNGPAFSTGAMSLPGARP